MSTKEIHGLFDDEEVLKTSAKALVAKGVHIKDVFSPFPIHGIDPIIGVPPTRLHIAGFIYGCVGFCLALFMFWFTLIMDWPMNIGGKPALALPSFVPISFELTVLFAAHGMVITFFIVTQYYPGKKAVLFDERQTDDVFVVVFEKDKIANEAEVREVLTSTGAFEVEEKTI